MKYKTGLIVASVCLLLALLSMPYGYYQLLRLIVCGVSIWAAISTSKTNQTLTVLYVLVALLYNPIFIIHFDRSTWGIINILTVLLFGFTGKIFSK